MDVDGGDLDVVESVILCVGEGVPAVEGEGGGRCQSVATNHNSLLPQPAGWLRLELKVGNLSILVNSKMCLQPDTKYHNKTTI